MVAAGNIQRLNRSSNFPTVNLWNSYLREALKEGEAHKSLLLFRRMKQMGLEPNNLTFPLTAKACAKLSILPYSQTIHCDIVKSPFRKDIFVQTALVDMYVKCNSLGHAYKLFERMSGRDVVSWNAIIMGFAQYGYMDRVSTLLKWMRMTEIRPDSVTVVGLTQSFFCVEDLRFIKAIHSFGIRIGVEDDVTVANTLIAAYAKSGGLILAEMVFDGIELDSRTSVSWNSMIAGHARFGNFHDTVNLYSLMLRDRFRPDISTILSLLSSCVLPEALSQGRIIHCQGIQLGCDFDVTVANTVISMYSKCGDLDSASSLFNGLLDKTRVSWTAMISGHAENGELDEALTLFRAMEAAGEKPDLVTMISLMSGCGQMGALELGRWVDNYATFHCLTDSLMVCNALIDMYAKCGSVSDSLFIFCNMPERTVVSWTTMISGCALNGEFEEALSLFYSMVELGFKPNKITFLAVLQACRHGGYVEKGQECFCLMTVVYKIIPELDHYSCMIDLLGRGGKLKEALNLIHSIPSKPDAGIWGALLAASKNHRDIEIGEYAAHRLLELDPHSAVSYVGLANIYASAERWDGVAKIRTMMKSKKVRKFPGQSAIRVNGKSHTFTVEHIGHPNGLMIYSVLDVLSLHMKEEGTVLELEQILNLELG